MSQAEETCLWIKVNRQNLERVGGILLPRKFGDWRRYKLPWSKENCIGKRNLQQEERPHAAIARSASIYPRKRMVTVFVFSVALFGSEMWTSQKQDIRRLEAFEMWRRTLLWDTKNNVLGLVTEEGGSYCWIWRTKDVGIRQIKLASTKMETFRIRRILQRESAVEEEEIYLP